MRVCLRSWTIRGRGDTHAASSVKVNIKPDIHRSVYAHAYCIRRIRNGFKKTCIHGYVVGGGVLHLWPTLFSCSMCGMSNCHVGLYDLTNNEGQ